MRSWVAPEKVSNAPTGLTPQADILVTELLGSFGDNELSPECLDGAQKVLKGKLDLNLSDVQTGESPSRATTRPTWHQ